MAEDLAEEGHFLSALGSFASRTCYANSSGMHAIILICLEEVYRNNGREVPDA